MVSIIYIYICVSIICTLGKSCRRRLYCCTPYPLASAFIPREPYNKLGACGDRKTFISFDCYWLDGRANMKKNKKKIPPPPTNRKNFLLPLDRGAYRPPFAYTAHTVTRNHGRDRRILCDVAGRG